MDGLSGDASSIELLCQTVCTVLGPSEDDATIDHLRLDQLHEQATLVRLPDEGDVLVDAIGGGRLGAHVDANRIMEHRRDEVADALRHRCTEQEVLTALRQEREDPPDVPNEAHVEHLVGLIEHQVGQIGQIEMTLLLQIEQASGRGDEDVDALPEGLDPGMCPTPPKMTKSSGRACPWPSPTADLGGRFTSVRGERSNRSPVRRTLGCEMMEDREREGRRLPCPSLGNTEDIPAIEEGRDGHRLDRRRRTVPLVGHSTQQALIEGEIVEVHPSVHHRLSTPRLNPEVRSGSVPDVPALMLRGAEGRSRCIEGGNPICPQDRSQAMNHHVRPLTASLLVLLILMAGCTAGLDEGSDDSIDCDLVQPGEYVYTAGPLTSYVHVQASQEVNNSTMHLLDLAPCVLVYQQSIPVPSMGTDIPAGQYP